MLTASMTSTHSLSSSAAADGESPLEAGANSVWCASAKFTPANSEVGNLPVFAAASGSEDRSLFGFQARSQIGGVESRASKRKSERANATGGQTYEA